MLRAYRLVYWRVELKARNLTERFASPYDKLGNTVRQMRARDGDTMGIKSVFYEKSCMLHCVLQGCPQRSTKILTFKYKRQEKVITGNNMINGNSNLCPSFRFHVSRPIHKSRRKLTHANGAFLIVILDRSFPKKRKVEGDSTTAPLKKKPQSAWYASSS